MTVYGGPSSLSETDKGLDDLVNGRSLGAAMLDHLATRCIEMLVVSGSAPLAYGRHGPQQVGRLREQVAGGEVLRHHRWFRFCYLSIGIPPTVNHVLVIIH